MPAQSHANPAGGATSRHTLPLPMTTDRLVLRPYLPSDAPATYRYYRRPDVVQWVPWEPWTMSETEARVRQRCSRTTLEQFGSVLSLVVTYEDVLVGDVCLWPTDDTLQVGEMGWAFDPAHHGRGFATEAVRALIGTAFGPLGMHRVVARVDPRNAPSLNLCRRVGMATEGRLRRHSRLKGEWVDSVLFGLLDSER